MASSYLEVGSQGLTDLKNDLTNLSKALHELYELMNADMRNLGQAWRDGKYEEFVDGYRPQINKCEEISLRYTEWCGKVLDPAIEKCIRIEKHDVSADGGGGVSSSSGGGGSTGGDRPLTSAEKVAKMWEAKNRVQKKINDRTPGPQGSGFDTPQNERPWNLFEVLYGKNRQR
ncbi:MAG: hypothetical protein J6T33_04680 [Bacteroidales bacterium]|jgi:hypothetical protein|nr:hypothetical protein [Bacteroidales bacterium]MBP5241230.1 hypothetical protein [Bacteroidales bacterium]